MKKYLKIFTIGLAASLSLGLLNARANVDVSVGVQINAAADFYEPLAPSGVWVDVGSYGRCWRPAHVAVGWRPYCDGHWVWTDCGWYWASDEPWAWATYHYGSWAFDGGFGWVWGPGVEWAPAWVYWRVGGGYTGWAPCGPRGVVIAPSLFVFVQDRHFHERQRPSTVVVNNTTIINNTTEITQTRRETRNFNGSSREVVINNGPGVERIQKATGKKVTPVSVQTVDRETPVPSSMKNRRGALSGGQQSPSVQGQPTAAPEQQPERMDRRTSPSQEQPSHGNIDRQTNPRERPDKKTEPTHKWQSEEGTVPQQKPEQSVSPQQQPVNERITPSQPGNEKVIPQRPGNEKVVPSQPNNQHAIPQQPGNGPSSERPRGAPQYYPKWGTPHGNAPRYKGQQPPVNQPAAPAQGGPSGAPSDQQDKGGDKEQKKSKDRD